MQRKWGKGRTCLIGMRRDKSIRRNLFEEKGKGLEQMKEAVERWKEVERRREEEASSKD